MPYFKLSFAKRKVVVNRGKILGCLLAYLIIFFLTIWYLIPIYAQLFASIKHIFASNNFITTFIILLIFLLIFLLAFLILNYISSIIERKIDKRLDVYERNWRNADRGVQGEDKVFLELSKRTDKENYRIYPNLTLPTCKWDLDFVVVGVKGVILIEVKNYKDSKDTYTRNHSFYTSKVGGLINDDYRDLRSIVKRRADRLEKYLAEHGVDNINVRKAIVYLNPNSVDIKEYGGNNNRVYIASGLNGLQKYLDNSMIDGKCTPEFCAKINKVLESLQ